MPGSPTWESRPVALHPQGRGHVPQQGLQGLSRLPTPSLSPEHTGHSHGQASVFAGPLLEMSPPPLLFQFLGCPSRLPADMTSQEAAHVCAHPCPCSHGFHCLSSWASVASVLPKVTHSPQWEFSSLLDVGLPTGQWFLEGGVMWFISKARLSVGVSQSVSSLSVF